MGPDGPFRRLSHDRGTVRARSHACWCSRVPREQARALLSPETDSAEHGATATPRTNEVAKNDARMRTVFVDDSSWCSFACGAAVADFTTVSIFASSPGPHGCLQPRIRRSFWAVASGQAWDGQGDIRPFSFRCSETRQESSTTFLSSVNSVEQPPSLSSGLA